MWAQSSRELTGRKQKSSQPFFTVRHSQPLRFGGGNSCLLRTLDLVAGFSGTILISGRLLSDGFLLSALDIFLRIIAFFTYLSSFIYPASLLPPLLSPSPPPCAFVHAHICAHTHIHIVPPPLSPCGFKVLILIRFELTYCQSSFSCSSEALGS